MHKLSEPEEHFNIEEYWKEQKNKFKSLWEKGFKKYIEDTNINTDSMFRENDNCVRCIDEGISGGGIRIGGSGILHQEQVVEALKGKNIKGVYSHAECGCATVYINKNKDKIDISLPPDYYAIEWAKKLAEICNTKYLGHIDWQKDSLVDLSMQRPEGFHRAFVAYYDATGRFNNTEQLPQGFIISRSHFAKEVAQKNIRVAIGIAFSERSFGGNRLTFDHPFLIVPITDSDNNDLSLEVLRHELHSTTYKYPDQIRIDTGLTVLNHRASPEISTLKFSDKNMNTCLGLADGVSRSCS